jgi:F420-dependent oxidoreductase-like protein
VRAPVGPGLAPLQQQPVREAAPRTPSVRALALAGCSPTVAQVDFRILTEPQQGASYEDLLAVARAAEDAGFSAFFRSDHLLAMGGEALPGPTDSWTTLAGLARETSRIRLGTLVSPVTFRLPGPLAVQVAQVDQMSGGRVELGLGAGWFEAEHAAYGIPFPDVTERFDRFEEQLAIITGLWDTPVGERFDFAGRHYRLTGSPALPKPVQRPVPVIIGGYGRRRTSLLAARYAAEFNLAFPPLEDVAPTLARVRAACEEVGRTGSDLVWSVAQVICVGSDDAEVRRRVAAVDRTFGGPREELYVRGAAGSPTRVVDHLGRLVEAGVERVYLEVLDITDLDHLELFASAVVPQLR